MLLKRKPVLRNRASRKTGGGFMLTELLVVIAIIALLVSILMPTLQKAKDLSKDLICATNQRALATDPLHGEVSS